MVRASPPPGKIFGALIEEVRFAADSLLAQAGFELFVPRGISASTSWWSRAWKSRGTPEEGLSVAGPPLIGDRGFESVSLQ